MGGIHGVSRRALTLRGLVAVALAVELMAWWGSEGYPVADAIGYMDRARTLVFEGELHPGAENLRSFVFPLLFAPLFLVARLLDLADTRWILPVARSFQVAIATGLVVASARLGARLFDRRTGLTAGFLVALAPVFLAHSSSPVADLAAALCATLGLERLLDREHPERWRAGGFLCGLGFLVSYKTLALYAVLAGLLLLADRLRRPSRAGALLRGLAGAAAVQVAIDRVVYGRWGHSLLNYLVDNVLGVLARLLLLLDLRQAGFRVYAWMSALRGYRIDPTVQISTPARQLQPPAFYLTHLPELLVWPVLFFFAAGLVRVLRRRRGHELGALALAAGYVFLLSQKGSKSLRLLLPVLPILAAVAAFGLSGLLDAARSRGRAAGWAFLGTAGLLVLAFGWRGWLATGPRAYGAYWEAMDSLNRRVAAHPPPRGRRVRVASAHYFATFLRNRPEIVPVRYRFPPWRWHELEGSGSPALDAQIRRTFNDADWLLQPERMLRERPLILKAVQRNFTVAEGYYEPGAHSARLGPVLVLESRERPGSQDGRGFLTLLRDRDPAELARERGFGAPRAFRHTRADGTVEELDLLGWTWETLPGSGLGWLTWCWYARTGFARDYQARVRLVDPDGRVLARLDHWPPYGVDPRRYPEAAGTSRWQPGWIVCESQVVPRRLELERAGPEDPAAALLRVELLAYEDGDRPAARLRPASGATTPDEHGIGILLEVGRLKRAPRD